MGRPPSRERLSKVLRASRDVVTVKDAAATLKLDRRRTAKLLSRWAEQGWLERLRRGVYAPVPIDSAPESHSLSNPWLLIPKVFDRAYVGGWSAAEHWGLTEQLFRDVCVFTPRPFRSKRQTAGQTTFVLTRVGDDQLFGLSPVWIDGTRIQVSDPHRTVVDMIAWPPTGGGMHHVAECVATYLRSEHVDLGRLVAYAKRLGNGVVFKRLGYLLEKLGADTDAIAQCREHMSSGYSKLDPALPSERLATRWNLWIPEGKVVE